MNKTHFSLTMFWESLIKWKHVPVKYLPEIVMETYPQKSAP